MMILTAQAFPPRSGGIENLMGALAFYAARAGEDVHVYGDGGAPEIAHDAKTKPPYKITRYSGIKQFRRRRKGKAVGAAAGQDDYIFADTWKSIEHLPAGLSVPVSVYAHGNELPLASADGSYAKQDRIRKALSKATHIFVNSSDTKSRIAPFLPAGMTPVIVNPPVEPAIAPKAGDEKFAENLWPADGLRLVTLSRLIAWKGIDQAIRACAALNADGIAAQLVIGGAGGDIGRLESIVAELGIKSRVYFAGRISDAQKTALYRSADIFLQPGRDVDGQFEGFGISYIEAALQGLPGISGNAGGAPDAVDDGVTGFVVDARETANVTEKLKLLATDKPLYTRMSKAAKARAEGLLWPAQVSRILQIAKSPAPTDNPNG